MERLKVLVVDDESRMRKLVRDFLVKKDFILSIAVFLGALILTK